jgi:hypothetical protein
LSSGAEGEGFEPSSDPEARSDGSSNASFGATRGGRWLLRHRTISWRAGSSPVASRPGGAPCLAGCGWWSRIEPAATRPAFVVLRHSRAGLPLPPRGLSGLDRPPARRAVALSRLLAAEVEGASVRIRRGNRLFVEQRRERLAPSQDARDG